MQKYKYNLKKAKKSSYKFGRLKNNNYLSTRFKKLF